MAVLNLVIIGPPGSGKGTQANLLSERLNLEHLEAGDILRDYVAAGGPRAAEVNECMQTGKLAPTEILLGILKEKLAVLPAARGVIFDGYARQIAEAKAVESMLADIGRRLDKVLYLKVDRADTIERIGKRLTCKKCDKTLILGVDVKSADEPCPKCGGELFRREDDSPEKIGKRWETFEEETKESIAYFRAQDLIAEINGDQPIEDVYGEIIARLGLAG